MLQLNTPEWSGQGQSGQLSTQTADQLTMATSTHAITTGQPRYVKLAYLEYTAYVEVIIHSLIFPLYCIVIRPCLCQTRLS